MATVAYAYLRKSSVRDLTRDLSPADRRQPFGNWQHVMVVISGGAAAQGISAGQRLGSLVQALL